MKIHHVDSKEHTLSAEDVLTVVAHDLKNMAADMYKKAGSPEGVTPERVLYTVFVDINKKPNFIRMREGNTLCVLIPQTETSAISFVFNADTPNNFSKNLVNLGKAASKMGYQKLTGLIPTDESITDSFVKTVKNLNSVKGFDAIVHKDHYELALP
jgi:hypothetical protein